jgi:hypothetical protein
VGSFEATQLRCQSAALTAPLVRISGFTFIRNAVSLGYPVREALQSILPMVDELVVVVAPAEPDDGTRELVTSLGDARVRVIDAAWDASRGELVYSDLTNLALDACTGDWCLYVQGDEVVHEDDHPVLVERCRALLSDERVEALLFDYHHFFGDYSHVQVGQGWYPREIRMVRNAAGIRSVRDAQSFRHRSGRRLTVARANASIFHYGWARHPALMQKKTREFWSHRVSDEEVEVRCGDVPDFDYGPLGRLQSWAGKHPEVMTDRIAGMDWRDLLRDTDLHGRVRLRHRDDRWPYRFLTGVSRVTGVDLNHKNYGRLLNV